LALLSKSIENTIYDIYDSNVSIFFLKFGVRKKDDNEKCWNYVEKNVIKFVCHFEIYNDLNLIWFQGNFYWKLSWNVQHLKREINITKNLISVEICSFKLTKQS